MIFFILCLTAVSADSGTLFKRSADISEENFKSHINQSMKARTPLDCARKCVHYEKTEGTCNAYSYVNDDCDLAKLSFLEDPEPGSSERVMYVDMLAAQDLAMKCRGGENCCMGDSPCADGEGDCYNDQGCAGISICGQDNCPIKTGGRWGEEDDCCERRCTPEHPCKEGEGHCTQDSDCWNPG